MPAQALYLKYRPQTFDDVVGQEHITNTLKNALELGRIAHAYLFTGTRGTGKTSTARILAKAVNCTSTTKPKPCNECAICRAINQERLLDLVEIDAASNTGVDNIRDLRDKVDFRPTEARYKVYIIDEAHMLSNAAFNALLKTLEEPPPHVIFILATTEANRLPATITSRCQRFDFRRATVQELVGQLGDIAKKEKMDIEPAALELVARQANGSFRDGTSLLDQLTAYSSDTVSLAHVQRLLGAASRETIHDIISSLAQHDLARGIAAIGSAVDAGADPRQVARDMVEYMRGVMLSAVKGDSSLNVGDETRSEMQELATRLNPEQAVHAIRLFSQAALDLRNSASPTLPLEMAFVEAALEPTTGVLSSPAPAMPRPVTAPSAPPPRAAAEAKPATKVARAVAAKKKPDEAEAEVATTVVVAAPGALSLPVIKKNWDALLARFRAANKSAAAFLRDAEPVSLKENTLTIGFFYEFHRDRFADDKRAKPQLEKIASEMFGTTLHVKCDLSPKKQKMQAAEDDPVIKAAMNLGGRIVDLEEE